MPATVPTPRRVGLREVNELHAPRRHRPHAMAELDARPLLYLILLAGEVDAGHRAHPPLRVRLAARIPVYDRVVRHTTAERIVGLALLRVLACGLRALILF